MNSEHSELDQVLYQSDFIEFEKGWGSCAIMLWPTENGSYRSRSYGKLIYFSGPYWASLQLEVKSDQKIFCIPKGSVWKQESAANSSPWTRGDFVGQGQLKGVKLRIKGYRGSAGNELLKGLGVQALRCRSTD